MPGRARRPGRHTMTVNEVAEFLDVSDVLVQRWVKSGLLESYTLPAAGKTHARRIAIPALMKFCTDHKIYCPGKPIDYFGAVLASPDEGLAKAAREEADRDGIVRVHAVPSLYWVGLKVAMGLLPSWQGLVLDTALGRRDVLDVVVNLQVSPIRKHLFVLVLVGEDDEGGLPDWMAAGADRCVLKPLSLPGLLHGLARDLACRLPGGEDCFSTPRRAGRKKRMGAEAT